MSTRDLVVTKWGARFGGRRLPCSIGRSGFTKSKREGDGATPVTPMRILSGFYRPDRISPPPLPFEMKPIGPRDIWSDDISDPLYNHLRKLPEPKYSHERLRRSDPLYDLVLVTDYNYPNATAGAGSAIFVHIWRKRRYPTEGCVAFERQNLLWILERWTERSRITIRT
ncbi:L,D-transpeptidase family protein [Halocynthiibacter sp. C4]|uniref:L,D-transpeptidase family protein n=1 Tax=Halocynthiibacter sp. C4 TaxID=2992758 RepID=UPI00237C3738|nr:L,D-transpeptidase family protein [Halocynthiibacter sp. C4]MDE0591077.1 L,D-transpeptidase family protein [Halocynthiibacter sp. C4]